MKSKILVVEDDSTFVDSIKQSLRGENIKIIIAQTMSEGMFCFNQHDGEFDCVVMDHHLPDGKGADLASHFLRKNPRSEIVFTTGDLESNTLVQLLDVGCRTFIKKGVGNDEIRQKIMDSVSRFRRERMLLKPIEHEDKDKIAKDLWSIGIVGQAASMHEVFSRIMKIRDHAVDALILGETGVGKELVAKAIANGQGSFVAVNGATYGNSDNFAERDFFGCVKGAYTGAIADQKGIFESAHGGFVFLDEVHAMSLGAQRILLRALQERKFKRMGDNSGREISLNCRIIYGGKAELKALAESGQFVSDLYYRIKKNTIQVPALRDRVEDIDPLIRHFTEKYSKLFKKQKYFLSDTLPLLTALPWPGNVRDLENMVSDLILETDSEIITQSHVCQYLKKTDNPEAKFNLSPEGTIDLKVLSDSFNAVHIRSVLEESETFAEAAKRLKTARSTLYDRCKKLGIKIEEFFPIKKEITVCP